MNDEIIEKWNEVSQNHDSNSKSINYSVFFSIKKKKKHFLIENKKKPPNMSWKQIKVKNGIKREREKKLFKFAIVQWLVKK